jgi:hypothetical protein
MTEETIGNAIKAYGRALAAGQTQESAMRAAFNSVFGLGGPNTKRIALNGVDLVVSFDGEPEDGWSVMVQHGTDIATLLSDDHVAVIDRILPKAPDVLIDSMGFYGSVGVR